MEESQSTVTTATVTNAFPEDNNTEVTKQSQDITATIQHRKTPKVTAKKPTGKKASGSSEKTIRSAILTPKNPTGEADGSTTAGDNGSVSAKSTPMKPKHNKTKQRTTNKAIESHTRLNNTTSQKTANDQANASIIRDSRKLAPSTTNKIIPSRTSKVTFTQSDEIFPKGPVKPTNGTTQSMPTGKARLTTTEKSQQITVDKTHKSSTRDSIASTHGNTKKPAVNQSNRSVPSSSKEVATSNVQNVAAEATSSTASSDSTAVITPKDSTEDATTKRTPAEKKASMETFIKTLVDGQGNQLFADGDLDTFLKNNVVSSRLQIVVYIY